MQLVKPSIELMWITPQPLQTIERAARICYKSEARITIDSAAKLVKHLKDSGHYAMLEHASASYKIVCDRGVSHELVRHRLPSFAQESTRYCNYKGGVTFIIPPWFYKYILEGEIDQNHYYVTLDNPGDVNIWMLAMFKAEESYINLSAYKQTPQQARSVLPNSLKTEIVITCNLREWMHIFSLRCTPSGIPEDEKVNGIYYGAKAPHPQMQEVANMIRNDIRQRVAVLFDD